jgi:mono/diheme cytochrome c family protein
MSDSGRRVLGPNSRDAVARCGAHTLLAIALALLGCGVGCDGEVKKRLPPASAAPFASSLPTAGEVGAQLYRDHCAACHGLAGAGDGPVATTLPVAPRDLTTTLWQDATSDAALMKVIVYGGAAVGKSAAMPASPELATTPDAAQALVAAVRGFRRP